MGTGCLLAFYCRIPCLPIPGSYTVMLPSPPTHTRSDDSVPASFCPPPPPHPDGWPDRLVSWLRACLIPILACNGQRYKQRLCKCLVTVGATLALPWACHGGSISTVMELLADLPASWLVPEPEAVNGGLSSAAR